VASRSDGKLLVSLANGTNTRVRLVSCPSAGYAERFRYFLPSRPSSRAMNIIYETTKERGATILMPSSMVDSLNPTAATLAFALAANDPLANNRAALNVDAPVTRGAPVGAGNGPIEPDRLPHPSAA
jgi:hypothetical protein